MTGEPYKRPPWSMRVGIAAAEIILLLVAAAAGAGIYRQATAGEIVNTSLGCVETVMTEARPPTGPSLADGGGITFRDDIAPHNGVENQQILGVYVPPGNYPVGNVGDKVRVCLLSVPEKSVQATGFGCDPAKDIRGRVFLVYDRANGSAEVYANGEHGCGGA